MIRTIASNLLLKSNRIYPKMSTADTADVGEVFLVAGVGFAQEHSLQETT